MNDARWPHPRHLRRIGFAANIAAALFLIGGMPSSALAIECSAWTSAQGDQRDAEFEAAVDDLLGSERAQQWTTLNMGLIKNCILAYRGRIQAEFDGLCAQGMQTPMDALDDKLYDYAMGCVRA